MKEEKRKMWPPSYKISNKDFYSFIFRSKDKQEELFGLEKVYLNRLINILPPAMLEQLQHQRALTLTRSVMPSTFWNLSRNGLTPYQLERHLLSLNNMFMETITPRTSSIQPEHISNNLPTGNILNDVFLRLQINSQNTQLTETNAIASCFGAINRADIMHMHRATAHATVAQFANDYQTLQMLKHFINIPATTTTANITSCCNPESTLKTSKEYFHNSLNRFNCKTFPSRNTHESREQRLPRKRFRTENIADRSNDPNFVQNYDNADNLLPPPKKKWIRHYLTEDIYNDRQSLTTSGDNNDTTKQLLLSDHAAAKSNNSDLHEHDDWQGQQSQQEPEIDIPTPAIPPPTSPSFTPKHTLLKPTKFTLMASNGEVIGNVATTNKQMLLASGIRIASSVATKAVSIPQNSRTLSFPLHHTTSTGKPKTFIPLTPPPMSSRKFVEPTHSRIRSFSLSSHKLSANHHQLQFQMHNGSNNNTSSTNMIVDDVSPPPVQPTQQHSNYSVSLSGQLHSPPRSSVGNHYIQMINSAAVQQATNSNGLSSGTGHVTHVTPRRRTISSNSNGAGTREVHNKLEKNRRAHLKECYEALKNQLSLKDEDRRKTSNLAILGEALKCVQSFQRRNQELEAEWEHLANDKINLQKRIVSLKRELGPKYEQLFSGIFPDIDLSCIPTTSDRENLNETISLSSGRGSTLYSSSSSLSSGGSNGSSNSSSSSNTMSSPVGAGLQTAIPTAISPVINKTNNSNNNSTVNIMNNSNNSATSSPINNNNNNNNNVLHNYRKNATAAAAIQAITIPTNTTHISPMGSPTALITFGSAGNGGNMPLSLTAKNISATSVTRGSPTPSTPSPSPSSSSGVSSSSSLISSSPPINGVISNSRNVTVNIPNGLKFQATVGALGTTITGTSGTTTTTAASMIVTTTNNTNNEISNNVTSLTWLPFSIVTSLLTWGTEMIVKANSVTNDIYATYTLTLVVLQTKAYCPDRYEEKKILGKKKTFRIIEICI
ncbi:uncharacterized protein ACN2A1_012514 isoform 8-T14 [Glossina fuscipes fuscipes]